MVGGFRRRARVRGVSSSVRCAAVAMVALRAAGLRVEVRARAALGLRSRGRGRTSPQAQRRLPGLGAAFYRGFPIVRTGTVAFIVSGRPQRRSAVSTLVRLILNQTPLRGLRDMPGARARPRRHGRDVYDDLSSTTAAPGCPRLPLPLLRVAA